MSGTLVTNDSYEILTPSGWQNFLGVKRDLKTTVCVRFSDQSEFSTTPEHLIKTNGKFVTVSSLRPGNKVYNKRVVEVKLSKVEFVYDPIEVYGGNEYLSEGLINHNCSFLGSSLTLINAQTISEFSPDAPIYTNEGFDAYEEPIRANTEEPNSKNHVYCLVADTAKGVGGDYSAFVVVDITEMPYRVVGKYRDNTISPMLYPSAIYKVARDYNNAFVLVEINSSEQVADILYNEYEYENLLLITRDNGNQNITSGFGGVRTQFGVVTDKKVKRIGCSNFKSLVEEKKLLIPDADIISEISTFIQVKNSYEADDGYHDDLVMPLVLFAWTTTSPYFKEMQKTNIRHALYDKRIQVIESNLTPFGFYNDGSSSEINNSRLPSDGNHNLTPDQIELLNF